MKIDISKIAKKKTAVVKKKILEALAILEFAGIILEDLTPRRLEKMAMAFMATANVTAKMSWLSCSSAQNNHVLRTREIITFINEHFEENISPGSYDDIRRKDLRQPVGMGLIIKSANNPNADTNDGTRGYGLSSEFQELCQTYQTNRWQEALQNFTVDAEYRAALTGQRDVEKLEVSVAEGVTLTLDHGPHNVIQRAVIEEFLPRFGYGAEVLYIGDTSNKGAYKCSEMMLHLGLNLENRGMLPDIVAFSEEKKWLYLIEAVHSANPLDAERCIELQRSVLKKCPYGVVYVTAFLTRKDFSRWVGQIAWETEVWLVEKPDHMIHFNGDRFMGPHQESPRV